jgi:hypothetical protein
MAPPNDDTTEVDLASEVSITDPVEFDYGPTDIAGVLEDAGVSASPNNV